MKILWVCSNLRLEIANFKVVRLGIGFTLASVDCCLLAFEAFGDALDKIDHNNTRFFYCIIFAWGIGQNWNSDSLWMSRHISLIKKGVYPEPRKHRILTPLVNQFYKLINDQSYEKNLWLESFTPKLSFERLTVNKIRENTCNCNIMKNRVLR